MRGRLFRIGDKVGFDVELSSCTLRSVVVTTDRPLLSREPVELLVESSSLFGAAEESVRLEANVAYVLEDGSGAVVAFDADDRLQLVNAETSDLLTTATPTSGEIASRPPIFDSAWWEDDRSSQADTTKVRPPSFLDPPPLLDDGATVLFRSKEHFAAQLERNLSRGRIVVQPAALEIGERRKISLLVPGREPVEIWVAVVRRDGDAVACDIEGFSRLRAAIEHLAI
jgi:hypothetical protein